MVGNTVVKVDTSHRPYMDNPPIILERREYIIIKKIVNQILNINCLKITRKKRKCSIYLILVKIVIRTLLQEHKSLMPKSAIENAV